VRVCFGPDKGGNDKGGSGDSDNTGRVRLGMRDWLTVVAHLVLLAGFFIRWDRRITVIETNQQQLIKIVDKLVDNESRSLLNGAAIDEVRRRLDRVEVGS